MELQNIAAKLNITSYPDFLNNVRIDKQTNCICDPNWVDKLEQSHKVFGQYHALVREAAQQLQQDENRLYWGQVVSTVLPDCNVEEARQIPMPKSNNTLAGDFLPLLILMTQLKNCIAEYQKRGMPEDMIRRNLDHFVDGISIVERRTGRPAIDLTYFRWLVKFIKAKLFNSHGFNFEIKELPSNVCILQEINTAKLFPVFISGIFHHTGKPLGSAGCESADDSFEISFMETDTEIVAHGCCNGIAERCQSAFSKCDFRVFLRPGDPVISVHIPRGTDISASNAAQALKAGFEDAAAYYPDHGAKAIYCRSWLLDPTFKELLKPTAKIPAFGNLFTKFPSKSAGNEVFSFVFERSMPLDQLPERTSLERAIKQHYLNGKYIHAYAGVTLPELL